MTTASVNRDYIFIDTISSQCGFSEPAYFFRTFKRLQKITPLEYSRGLNGKNHLNVWWYFLYIESKYIESKERPNTGYYERGNTTATGGFFACSSACLRVLVWHYDSICVILRPKNIIEVSRMYNYRKMTEEQRKDVLRTRRINKMPLHEPFHKHDEYSKTYLISAANFEHSPIMKALTRRQQFKELLLSAFHDDDSKIHCWCILPNHYHILINTDLAKFKKSISRIHWKTSHQWNTEDSTPGRKVWFRFSDRAMKNEAHYWDW